MGKYIVKKGQNIFDVSLSLTGSIEGVVDLLISNPNLSFSTILNAGDELNYSDEFVINKDVLAYNMTHSIIPANGEHHVYPKWYTLPQILQFYVPHSLHKVECFVSGEGRMEIDWGDNSPIESFVIPIHGTTLVHTFDNIVSKHRVIRWFTRGSFKHVNLTGFHPLKIFALKPFNVEEFELASANIILSSFALSRNCYSLSLTKISTSDLTPLLSCKELIKLDLRSKDLSIQVVDHYLLSLVKNYGQRRSCHVLLDVKPSGVYQEPRRDLSTKRYIPESGMEAIWVIVNEPTWNEAEAWQFSVLDQTYTKAYE